MTRYTGRTRVPDPASIRRLRAAWQEGEVPMSTLCRLHGLTENALRKLCADIERARPVRLKRHSPNFVRLM